MLRSIFARAVLLAFTATGLALTGCATRGTVAKLKDDLTQAQREADRNATAAAIAQQTAISAQSNSANQAAFRAQTEAALATQRAEQALREANEARSAAAATPVQSTEQVTVTEEIVKKPVYKRIGSKDVKRRTIRHTH